jgi:hypothetical protein
VQVWKIQTSPKVALTRVEYSPNEVAGSQDPGFFTTISSSGTASPIIWALSRPVNSGKAPLDLFAFNPDGGKTKNTIKQLFKAKAGFWPNLGGNSNLVPVVANGQVFVASNKVLEIFGLIGAKAAKK